MDLEKLFAEIETAHHFERAADSTALDVLEAQLGCSFPKDVKAFYRRYHTVRLFESDMGPSYRFVPVNAMHQTRIDIFGPDSDEWGPENWITICDVQDGNYIAIDIDSFDGESANFIDCFHETFALSEGHPIIAKSFTELLERALRSHRELFWLQGGLSSYGDAWPTLP